MKRELRTTGSPSVRRRGWLFPIRENAENFFSLFSFFFSSPTSRFARGGAWRVLVMPSVLRPRDSDMDGARSSTLDVFAAVRTAGLAYDGVGN